MDRQKSIRRGFSLVEAAIVLAVVGLVVAGIWIAAATMMENYRFNKTVEGIFTTASNIQNLISMRDGSSLPMHADLKQTLIASSAFPKDWVNGNLVKHPLGGIVGVMSIVSGVEFVLWGLNPSSCIEISVRIAATAAMAGSRGNGSWSRPAIGGIDFYSSSGNYVGGIRDFPVAPSQVSSFCKSGMISSSSYIVVLFSYTRIN